MNELVFFSSNHYKIKEVKKILENNNIKILIFSDFIKTSLPKETGKTFKLSKKKSSREVSGDEEQLNRVFINLIKNSIESIDEKKSKTVDFKGEINIDIKADSDYIYVTIIDNGLGFGLVDKTKMLTPYYTTKKKGTGLGLAIVTKVISDHNGTILFDSIKDRAKVDIILPKYYG